jgi:hypothetical protein
VQPHPDHPDLLFAVPADDFPLAGSTDVAVRASPQCPGLNLRCGQGIWIRADDLERTGRLGSVDPEAITAARRVLAALARGNIDESPAALEIEADPEYQHWIREVEQVRAGFVEWLNDSPTLRLSDFGAERPHIPFARRDELMAATSGGLLGEVADLLSQLLGDRPTFHPVPITGPGDFHLRATQDGVGAVWIGTEGKPPLFRAQRSDGSLLKAKWRVVDAMCQETTEPFPWDDDRVILQIGPRNGRSVTVRR